MKDEVQDEVARMHCMEIRTTIEKDTTLNLSVWQENGTHEAFLMHVTAVLDVIKKRGHFDDYAKAAWNFKEAREAVESARAGLSLLEDSMRKASKDYQVPTSILHQETHAFCARNMGAHVRRTCLEFQWYEKRDEKSDSCAAGKGVKKLVSSDFAKILK
jgi:hypothetical protein